MSVVGLGSYIITLECTKCNTWSDKEVTLPTHKTFYVGCRQCRNTRLVLINKFLTVGRTWEYLIPKGKPWLQVLNVKIKRRV